MKDQNFTVRVLRMRNPPTNEPTGEIIVMAQKYYSETDTGDSSTAGWYDMQGTLNLDDGFTYQVTGVEGLRSVKATRFPMDDGTGYLAGNPTKVLFEIEAKQQLSVNAAFVIQFPESSQIMLNPNPTTKTCYTSNMQGFEQDRIYCETFAANRTVIVRNYCVVAECTTTSSVGGNPIARFLMMNDFILNYGVVKSPLDKVEDSLVVRVTTDKTFYYAGEESVGVFITPSLKPNRLIFVNPEVIRTNSYINQQTTWIINFKTNTNTVPAGGSLKLAVPSGVMMYMGETP